MARAPVGARRRARAADGWEAVRKGPWMEEEDAVLREHVRVHGPRDWSSIRSEGLLPRTGKSCRLRWVNKLRPNLKSCCKFSSDEERVVLDLQARFGNKWAMIAAYLPGRTDNDVKNFWSTRQKRLARLMSPLRPRQFRKNLRLEKAAASSSPESRLAPVPSMDQVPFEDGASSGQCPAATPSMDAQNAAQVPYDQSCFQHLGPRRAFLPASHAPDIEASSSDAAPLLAWSFNDVNDFWSTSLKQPGRLLCTALPVHSNCNCGAKTTSASSLEAPPTMDPILETIPLEGSSSGDQFHARTAFRNPQKSEQVPYDQTGSQLFGFGGAPPPVALATDIQATSSASLWPPQLQLYPPPYPLLDFPGTWGSSGMAPGFVSAGAPYDFAYHQEQFSMMQSSLMTSPFFGMNDGVKIEHRGPPDQFDDLPPDLYNNSADQLPPASSPSRTISDF